MALPAARTTITPAAADGTESPAGAAFEHLVVSAQGVITKRIDLALLEGREVVSETLQRAAWGAVGMLMATAAWLSLALSLVFLFFPNASPATRLASFALINGIAATLVFAAPLNRRSKPNPPR